MVGLFRVEEIDIDYEKRILINIITNTKFCFEFSKIYKQGFFKNSYLDKICSWCFDFMSKYKESPNAAIVDIFENEKRKIRNPGQANNIEIFLAAINDNYLEEEDPNFNLDYFLDEAKRYYQRRVFIQTLENSIELANRFELVEAESNLKERLVSGLSEDSSIGTNDKNNFIDKEDFDGDLFTFSSRSKINRFEELLGPFKRGFLVAFLGKMKAGKSFFLLETALQGAENNLKVLFISLEMPTREVLFRYKTRLTARGEKKEEKMLTVFDCLNHQNNKCSLSQRVRSSRLYDVRVNFLAFKYENLPEYDYVEKYSPCTACREFSWEEYKPSIWFKRIEIKKYEEAFGWKKQQEFKKFYKNGALDIRAIPPHTLTVDKLDAILDECFAKSGTACDLLVVDYPDLMKAGVKSESRHELNEIWVGLKKMAIARDIVVVGASQVNRAALKKNYFSMGDVAEDIRKCAISDVIIGINQSVDDKEMNIVRLNCLLHRHKKFNEKKLLWCTQDLSISYPVIDAEFV